MKAPVFFALALLAGCASTEGGLPRHAPPFTGDRPITWPQAEVGTLRVTAFPKSASSKQAGTTAAWRLYNVDGRPVGGVMRDSTELSLPAGQYVVMARDGHGGVRTAQAVVRANAVTDLPLAHASQPEASATSAATEEE